MTMGKIDFDIIFVLFLITLRFVVVFLTPLSVLVVSVHSPGAES